MEVMMRQQDKPLLIAYQGEQKGKRWTLNEDRVTIGRASDCDIVLSKRQVSRHHARIERHDDGYFLCDLESKNGTYLNGQRIGDEPHRLKDGDEIQIALYLKVGFVGADATLPLELADLHKRLRIDRPARRVFIGKQELTPPLSPAQYDLLELLTDHESEVISREEVVRAVWPEQEAMGVSEQAIDALVHRLRDRIAAVNPDHDYIVTVRGHGFRLDNL